MNGSTDAPRPAGGRGYGRIVGMDPAADWLLGPARRDFLPRGGGEALIPFLISFDDPAALDRFDRLVLETGQVLLPALYRDGDRRAEAGAYVYALAFQSFFDALAEGRDGLEPLRTAPKRIRLGLALGADALRPGDRGRAIIGHEAPPVEAREDWPKGTVVIGIIDDGIAVAHRRFRGPGGTRVEAFWNQDGAPASPSVGYGRELGRTQIDALRGAATVNGLVEEDLLYRRAGLIDRQRGLHASVAWRAAHGTHVLDLAAGADPATAPENRPIIAVQLRVASTASQSGTDLTPDVIHAFDYILDRARRLTLPGRPMLPVVVVFSYATHTGPHDGTSDIEQVFEQRIARAERRERRAVRVVLPAGNSHLSRCHANLGFGQPGQAIDLPFRLQPDDRTVSGIEVWLPDSGGAAPNASRVALSLLTPDGIERVRIDEAPGAAAEFPGGGATSGRVSYHFRPAPTRRGCFRVELMPTIRLIPDDGNPGDLAPAGLWTLRLTNVSLTAAQRIDCWIERDDLVFGYPRRGRQPYFDLPCHRRFDSQGRVLKAPLPGCEIPRTGMVNGIGTGRSTIVVGGVQRLGLGLPPYTAGGPVVTPAGGEDRACERRPDILLVSDDSSVHAGVLAAGARSGSVVAMTGTSVAAPQLARWVADELAAGRPGDRDAVIAAAMAAEAALPAPPVLPLPPLPEDRGGWGRAPGLGAPVGRRFRT